MSACARVDAWSGSVGGSVSSAAIRLSQAPAASAAAAPAAEATAAAPAADATKTAPSEDQKVEQPQEDEKPDEQCRALFGDLDLYSGGSTALGAVCLLEDAGTPMYEPSRKFNKPCRRHYSGTSRQLC